MQAFLFGVWVEGGQVQVVHWLLTSCTSQATPSPPTPPSPGLSPKRVLAPGRCHHTGPGDTESLHGTRAGYNVTCLCTVSVGCRGGHSLPSPSWVWRETQGMGERGYPGKQLERLPAPPSLPIFCFASNSFNESKATLR